jgi:hypothetical protein
MNMHLICKCIIQLLWSYTAYTDGAFSCMDSHSSQTFTPLSTLETVDCVEFKQPQYVGNITWDILFYHWQVISLRQIMYVNSQTQSTM